MVILFIVYNKLELGYVSDVIMGYNIFCKIEMSLFLYMNEFIYNIIIVIVD